MENKFCNYKGLSLGKEEVLDITPEEIEAQLEQMVKESVSFEAKEGKSENGDIVNIDFEGFVDGVAFEGGKGEKYDLELGSNSFIPGFEEQLVGYEKGASVDVNVIFPEEYHAEHLKGKPAVFKCYIHEVKAKKPAERNDELAKKYGLETLDQLITAIGNKLKSEKQQKVANEFIGKVCNHLAENSEINLDEKKVELRIEELVRYYEESIAQYGTNLESYLQMTGMSMDQFKVQLRPEAEHSCKIDAIYDHIEKEENIVVTNEEFNNEIHFIKRYYKLNDEQINKFIEERGEMFKKEIIRAKISDFLFKNND